MFRKILIANRGEIALRIIRTCREMGIKTVAVHSEADAEAMHVKLADEAVCIGPAASKKSYLNMIAILSAAEVTGADAIHPGYGFLSENENFAAVCGKCGITFIGPTPENMRQMGNKIIAKEIMRKAGVPTLPGSLHALQNEGEAKSVAQETGYPVIFKAAAGGGGRGMAIVESPDQIDVTFHRAQSEAEASFGDKSLYLEKFLAEPRHIEVQVIGDKFGNYLHLGERDCTLQRRHQKILEEATSPFISTSLRERIRQTAVLALETVGYQNVGTIEFLVEGDQFYFMEMNTRIQVEHPVTEMITGIDLVREQILVSANETLKYKQQDISFRGHSIECRINAEDPKTFHPSPGQITGYHPPGGQGVRVESALYHKYTVLPHYDSLIAKLVVHADSRDEAIKRMQGALDEFIIEGIKTNIPIHQKILNNRAFHDGKYHTGSIHAMIES